jgi:hypothetical protein
VSDEPVSVCSYFAVTKIAWISNAVPMLSPAEGNR